MNKSDYGRAFRGLIPRSAMQLPNDLFPPFRSTYEKIFQPYGSVPLEWREVRALFIEIGEAGWERNGDFKVVRNGQTLILRPAPTKDVSGPDELLELRRFLEHSAAPPERTDSRPASPAG